MSYLILPEAENKTILDDPAATNMVNKIGVTYDREVGMSHTTTCHMSHATCHMHATCYLLHVTCYMPHVVHVTVVTCFHVRAEFVFDLTCKSPGITRVYVFTEVGVVVDGYLHSNSYSDLYFYRNCSSESFVLFQVHMAVHHMFLQMSLCWH